MSDKIKNFNNFKSSQMKRLKSYKTFESDEFIVQSGNVLTMSKKDSTKEKANEYLQKIVPKIIEIIDAADDSVSNQAKALNDVERLFNHNIQVEEGEICFTLSNLADCKDMMSQEDYDKVKNFVLNFHENVRKTNTGGKEYMSNIWAIIHNSNHLLINCTTQDIIDAYEKTLDHYKGGLSGYWSMIGFEKNSGKIKGFYLGDTMDCDIFWENLKKAKGPLFYRVGHQEQESEKPKWLKNLIGDNESMIKDDLGHVAYLKEYAKELPTDVEFLNDRVESAISDFTMSLLDDPKKEEKMDRFEEKIKSLIVEMKNSMKSKD